MNRILIKKYAWWFLINKPKDSFELCCFELCLPYDFETYWWIVASVTACMHAYNDNFVVKTCIRWTKVIIAFYLVGEMYTVSVNGNEKNEITIFGQQSSSITKKKTMHSKLQETSPILRMDLDTNFGPIRIEWRNNGKKQDFQTCSHCIALTINSTFKQETIFSLIFISKLVQNLPKTLELRTNTPWFAHQKRTSFQVFLAQCRILSHTDRRICVCELWKVLCDSRIYRDTWM